MFTIKSIYETEIYTSQTAQTIQECVQEMVRLKISLQVANMQYANLQSANMRGANLQSANMRGANLQDANLRGANLRGANLRGANLQDANLRSANLQDANLQYANLQYAHLQYAHLQSANMQDANMQYAHLQYAHLQSANMQDANMQYANLRVANLRVANLQYANLQYAHLQSANMRGANMRGANLQGSNGINRFLTTPLLFLQESRGVFTFYKLTDNNLLSPFAADHHAVPIQYSFGETYEQECNEDETVHCASGLSVATLDWCIINWKKGWRIIRVEVNSEDIRAIPIGTDGKIRVYKLKVINEVPLEMVGLAP